MILVRARVFRGQLVSDTIDITRRRLNCGAGPKSCDHVQIVGAPLRCKRGVGEPDVEPDLLEIRKIKALRHRAGNSARYDF